MICKLRTEYRENYSGCPFNIPGQPFKYYKEKYDGTYNDPPEPTTKLEIRKTVITVQSSSEAQSIGL